MSTKCHRCQKNVIKNYCFEEKALCYDCFNNGFNITCFWCKSFSDTEDENELPVCVKMGSKKYGRKIHPGLEICGCFEGRIMLADGVKLKNIVAMA